MKKCLELIALALLISPAQASKLDASMCDKIAYIFDACSASDKNPPCYMVHRAGAGESKDLAKFFDDHPDLDLQAQCDKVCLGKTTVLKATRNFCPNYRPKP
ncbi:hypothetical protein [Bradyrhizobium sp. Ec3.3]|uniref:hypothetical protein n=1 Tax=Bradyrhizobium sp. Ec3.3 TaxID=189753 RepID=UPI00041800FB|nr:hypothetical protein [Bradyrhizobium sp. Ec3.3]